MVFINQRLAVILFAVLIKYASRIEMYRQHMINYCSLFRIQL